MIFENIYEKYKYKSDNKLFLTKFIREVFDMFSIDNKKIIKEGGIFTIDKTLTMG